MKFFKFRRRINGINRILLDRGNHLGKRRCLIHKLRPCRKVIGPVLAKISVKPRHHVPACGIYTPAHIMQRMKFFVIAFQIQKLLDVLHENQHFVSPPHRAL